MADVSRHEKLAAGRKKLKEFQKKGRATTGAATKKSPSEEGRKTSQNPVIANERKHLDENDVGDPVSQRTQENETVQHVLSTTYHQEDFTGNVVGNKAEPQVSSLDQNTEPAGSVVTTPSPDDSDSSGISRCNNGEHNSQKNNVSVSTENIPVDLCNSLLNSSSFSKSTEVPSCFSNCEASFSTQGGEQGQDRTPVTDTARQTVARQCISNTESLRQLSAQLNGLVSESSELIGGNTVTAAWQGTSELEVRNQQLASRLQNQTQRSQQLEQQVQLYKSEISKLQSQVEKQRCEFEAQLIKEVSPLREQLQVHVQTIGILVAEKTEIQAALAKSQNTAKQKSGEVEELQGRLKASRQHVSNLEKEALDLSSASDHFQRSSKELEKEVDRLKMEHYKINKQVEEMRQELSELQQKLETRNSECQALLTELRDVKSRCSLAELQLQQLTSSSDVDYQTQLETLHQEKVELEKVNHDLQQTLTSLTADQGQVSQQYRQYVQQLNEQVQTLTQQVHTLTEENQSLASHEQSLVSHVEEMERQLQTCGRGHESTSVDTLQQQVAHLQGQLEEAKRKQEGLLQSQVQDNAQLANLIEEKEVQIHTLESQLEHLQGEQLDKGQLLEAMQSDKIAASRAMTQNKQLKQQLEELQDGFIKMSNSKLQLTENLEAENHITKELAERLSQQEEELEAVRLQLLEKEQVIQKLQQSLAELSKHMYQQNQLTDRMRHFEAQGQLSDMLQQELDQAQERIKALSMQNSELRTHLAHQVQQVVADSSSSSKSAGSEEGRKKDEMLASLSASVRQLELERDQLLSQLEQRQSLQKTKEDSLTQGDINSNVVPEKDHQAVKVTLEKLEGRFTRTMNEIVELSEEKQRLEHLVLQLQGETETIGEYVALYQLQRGLLRQRAQEKDAQLAMLAQDREELRAKLNQLNQLVMQLLKDQEKGTVIPGCLGNLPRVPDIDEVQVNGSDENSGIASNNYMKDSVDAASSQVPSGQTREAPNTAQKIVALLSEIGSNNLVDQPVSDSFHPCPLCSGRLLTV